jgi:hypothetical protein
VSAFSGCDLWIPAPTALKLNDRKKYVEKSPILRTDTIQTGKGKLLFSQIFFGKREPKPKWEG